MVYAEFAQSQIARLSGTAFYSQRTQEAVSDLIECLRVMAEDDQEAEDIIGYWLQSERECPSVADLRNAIIEWREGRGIPPKPLVGCLACGNVGAIMVRQLVTITRAAAGRSHFAAEDIGEEVYQSLRLKLPETWTPNHAQFVTTAARKCRCGQ